MRAIQYWFLACGLSAAPACGTGPMTTDSGTADRADNATADRALISDGGGTDVGRVDTMIVDVARVDTVTTDVIAVNDVAVANDVQMDTPLTLDAGMPDTARPDVLVTSDTVTSDTRTDTATADIFRADVTADAIVDASDAPRRGPAPLNLGTPTNLASAGAYTLMAKTGITNVTGSLISGGHLGVSPEFSTSMTGFALILDSTTQFSTSISVASPWRVYTADNSTPTPANLTAAISSMEAAYTDAAGRTSPDFLNLASGNIGTLTLTPGLYHWGSTVTIAQNVTISGGANDVWIFQITNDLDVSANRSILLAGGAQARNIFWQVAGQLTIHANAHFEGIVVSQTGITLQTRASLHGRALAQTLVALDDNAITAP